MKESVGLKGIYLLHDNAPANISSGSGLSEQTKS